MFLHGQDFPFLETKQFVVLQTESQQLLDLLIRQVDIIDVDEQRFLL